MHATSDKTLGIPTRHCCQWQPQQYLLTYWHAASSSWQHIHWEQKEEEEEDDEEEEEKEEEEEEEKKKN